MANSLIKNYADDGMFVDAIRVYLDLLESGFPVQEFQFFPCLIKAFGGLGSVEKGEEIHGHLLKFGFLEDTYVSNSLLGMYWKCGAVEHADKMFDEMPQRDAISWNTMISGFSRLGYYTESLTLLARMIGDYGAVFENRVACLSALSSCASTQSLTHGRAIHGCIVKNKFDSDEYLVSGLIDMYMKCGDVKNAERVLIRILDDNIVRGNKVIWNVMITGYVSNECPSLALSLFLEMLESGIGPDSSTVVAVLVLCSQLLDIALGKQIHGLVVSLALENDVRVQTALIEMYFNCSSSETGLKIFRQSPNKNLIMWGSVISNCAQNGYPNESLQLFEDFMILNGFPDLVILLAALRACSSLALKRSGVELHGMAVKLGLTLDAFVGGALVDLYGKCGDMNSAEKVFDGLDTKDLVSWNALISGFAQNEYPEKALKAFRDMQSRHLEPNSVTVACILSVCMHLAVMILCKQVHCYILRHGFLINNILIGNSLISAYAKCGIMSDSLTIFNQMSDRNEVTWNSIILGFGMHGRRQEMFQMFERMKETTEVKAEHATFTALLSACSHGGEVAMGWKYFNSMTQDYNLEPRVEHYTCMVDLLGRAGNLNQAYDLIKEMPCSPDDRIWGSLLGSCKNHGNVGLARVVASHIFELDPTSIGYRTLLSNLYEESGRWNEVSQVRTEIRDTGVRKQPGCSWIEVDNNIHTFTAADCSHPLCEEIYATLESLSVEIKEEGYVPLSQSTAVGSHTKD
ncbi:unnamed protein product [Linum tenue]|uniref:Chlororespiratory reduction 21 n=4 Tax=Linum tenue TaxID=586396 RepID=A0AAV0INR4_9ROSI|nr:unnamed protein product [Linum tenue]